MFHAHSIANWNVAALLDSGVSLRHLRRYNISAGSGSRADGEYKFWIACDHNCQLWLSTDETLDNEVIIAAVDGVDRYTDVDEWGKYAAQQSGLIVLQAGKRYRVEATLKQGGGGEGLSVGWLKPGETGTQPSEVIPGKHLSPIEDSTP